MNPATEPVDTEPHLVDEFHVTPVAASAAPGGSARLAAQISPRILSIVKSLNPRPADKAEVDHIIGVQFVNTISLRPIHSGFDLKLVSS